VKYQKVKKQPSNCTEKSKTRR